MCILLAVSYLTPGQVTHYGLNGEYLREGSTTTWDLPAGAHLILHLRKKDGRQCSHAYNDTLTRNSYGIPSDHPCKDIHLNWKAFADGRDIIEFGLEGTNAVLVAHSTHILLGGWNLYFFCDLEDVVGNGPRTRIDSGSCVIRIRY